MEILAETTGHSPEAIRVWVALYADQSDRIYSLDVNPIEDMPDGGITLPKPEALIVE